MTRSRTIADAQFHASHRGRFRRTLSLLSLYLALFLFLFIVLSPFFWIVKSALSMPDHLFKIPPVYIPDVTFDNFKTLADQVPLV